VNDSARIMRRLCRARPPIARTAAALIGTTALALLTAACSSPSSANGSSSTVRPANSPSTNAQKAVAFSHCVRAHGVPNYPDPSSSGDVAKEGAEQLGVSSAQLQAALNHCEHLLPNTGNIDDNPAALNQWWSQMLQFARCMHSHGVPNWPDPSPYPPDPVRPTFNLHAAGIGFHQGARPGNIVNSPQIQVKVQQCESLVHQDVSGYFD
jgi:hypothetical protein